MKHEKKKNNGKSLEKIIEFFFIRLQIMVNSQKI